MFGSNLNSRSLQLIKWIFLSDSEFQMADMVARFLTRDNLVIELSSACGLNDEIHLHLSS